MSEMIMNREFHKNTDPDRLDKLKEIFKDLHNGKNIHVW